MRLNQYKLNEKGLTLVEVLAALTILGIVIVGFMYIFPQMTAFNAKTEAKLTTMNLAKRELAEIKNLPNPFEDYVPTIINDNGKPIIRYRKENQSYQFEIDYYETPELEGYIYESTIKLMKIHVKVKSGNAIVSETFGYIKDNTDK